jgi:hypothetical protein
MEFNCFTKIEAPPLATNAKDCCAAYLLNSSKRVVTEALAARFVSSRTIGNSGGGYQKQQQEQKPGGYQGGSLAFVGTNFVGFSDQKVMKFFGNFGLFFFFFSRNIHQILDTTKK